MYSVSLDYLVKIIEPTRTIATKIDVNNGATTLSPSDIIDWNIEYSFGNDKLPGIGGAVTSMLEVTLVRENLPLTFGTAPLKPYIGLEVSPGVIEWVPLGVFYMDRGTVEKTDLTIKFKAYDVLRRLDLINDFTSLDYRNSVVTVRDVATELATVCGIQYVDITQLPTWRVTAPLTGSAREQLAELAETAGANVCVARDGKIDFRTLTPSYYGVSTASYIEFKPLAEEQMTISTITCKKVEPEIVGGEPTNIPIEYTSGTGTGANFLFTNPMIDTQAKLDEVYTAAGYPLTYQPCYIKLQGMPMFDVGEIYTFEDKNADTYMLPILYHKLTYKGGLISEFEAAAPPTQLSVSTGSSGGAGSLSQTIRQIQTDIIASDLVVTNKLEAVDAKIVNLETTSLTAEDADIAYAQIDFANVGDAVIDSAMIQDGAITSAKIADATIVNADIADATIEGAKIALATIDTANIADAAITNAKIGNLAVDTAQIADAAIETAKIKDAAITNAKIGTAAIQNANIADATIQGAKIANATIETGNIAVGAITTALIGTAAVGTTQIADASITDAKVVDLSANSITAGTLSVDRLIFSGETDSIIYELNNIGELTSDRISTLNGDVLTPRTIAADKIVAESITAAEIAAEAITANQIAANTITAGNIQAATITGNEIAAGTITTDNVVANFGNSLDLSSNESVNIKIGEATADLASAADVEEIQSYFTFGTDLTIGKTDSPMQVSISNTQIDFKDSGSTVAYINGQKMYIDSLDILTSIILGNHKLEKFDADGKSFTVVNFVG